jgi:hypothetical protein
MKSFGSKAMTNEPLGYSHSCEIGRLEIPLKSWREIVKNRLYQEYPNLSNLKLQLSCNKILNLIE